MGIGGGNIISCGHSALRGFAGGSAYNRPMFSSDPNSSGAHACRAAAAILLLSGTLPAHTIAQSVPYAAQLARAYEALAAGRSNEALRLGREVLRERPAHHAAATVVVLAASSEGAAAALDAYERWLGASRHEDAFVLEPVGVAVLTALAQGPDGPVRTDAHGRLAQAGAPIPGEGTGDGPAPAVPSEAEIGPRLAAQLGRNTGRNQLLLLRALADTGYRDAAPSVVPLLDDPVPEHRAAAADTLAALGAVDAVPAIRQRLDDPSSLVRASAATALHRLGDGSGDTLLFDLLTSDVPDIQLQAAEAMGADAPSSWTPYIEPLLAAEAPMTRLQAARLFLPVDPERARSVLAELLNHPNPVVVEEMARTLEDERLADLPTIRRLLRHPAPAVRLHGASALLRLTGALM